MSLHSLFVVFKSPLKVQFETEVYDLNVSLTSLPPQRHFFSKKEAIHSPLPPPPSPPVFWSGINFREQRIFLRLMCGNTGYFCGLLENKKKQRNLSRIYVFSLGAPNYNLYSIHIILTFKMIGDVKQSRLLGVNKRILGFKTADRGQRFRESSGHTLLHVTQHGESTYK